MSFDCHDTTTMKPLLYADLFKRNNRNVPAQKQEDTIVSNRQTLSLSSSSSSNQFSYCDSSSSGFSTPLYSDSSDDGDFIAELSRQMAECMLQEEEEVVVLRESNQTNNPYSIPVRVDDDDGRMQIPPIHQAYQLKNQQPIIKGTESGGQQKQVKKTEQHFRGRGWGIGHGRNGQFGSGMQAVFLGGSGSGSQSGSSGTGVFLPHSTELKRKSGCSMVLMPTRVLQALELHHNRYKDSTNPPPITGGPLTYSYPRGESTISNGPRKGHSQTANSDDMQLPQEWTY